MQNLNIPKTITCRVLSIESLKALVETSLPGDDLERSMLKGESQEHKGKFHCPSDANNRSPTVLAGLHACGDLSVIMLKTFLDCRDVKAVVSIGCCYNLLSEESSRDGESRCGFPMSHAVRSTGLSLGKSARDLACQRDGGALICMLAFTTLSYTLFALRSKCGGISRAKKHQLGIKGDVVACLKVPAEVKTILHADMVEKERIKRGIEEVLVPLDADDTNEIDEISRIRSGKRRAETSSMVVKRTKGPLDLVFKKTKDTNINDVCNKEARARTVQYIARFVSTCGIAFNVANVETFKLMLEAMVLI
ncbi:hypothetical protein KIW84_010159 [Lathyrus oleraceus]|uniref:Methyltransferase domain-containing protein n=1 Tax=Pisum sativum TaxID=3888 RepID=A0A9D5BDF8_PEA|nr:hypothetical protein KIW84_010159 [Pisum sativum]